MSDLRDRSRTQAARRRASDQRMIMAAMHLIAVRGAANASLAEIGLAAGYSRGLPAERFGTKLGLLEAVIDSMEAWFRRHAPDAVGDRHGLPAVLKRAEAHLEGALKSPVATAAIYSLLLDSMQTFPTLRPRMQGLEQSFRHGFVVHLQEARSAGEIDPTTDCEATAGFIVGLLRGVFMQWLGDPSIDLKAQGPLVVAFIRQALVGPHAGPPLSARQHS